MISLVVNGAGRAGSVYIYHGANPTASISLVGGITTPNTITCGTLITNNIGGMSLCNTGQAVRNAQITQDGSIS